MIPETTSRVARNTSDGMNQRIQDTIEERLIYYGGHHEEIDGRLEELDREWDIERTLEANAAGLALVGVILGAFADRRFLLLPAAVAGFLMQHAIQGWCPPVPLLRRMGVRTAAEIGSERYALKATRGDFEGEGSPMPAGRRRVRRLLDAVRR